MSHQGHDAYLEGRILSADPLELVRLLCQGAGNAVRDARRRLAEGDIVGRSRAVSNAYDILAELLAALDHSRGGELAGRLALLYDYMQRRLLEANLQQSDAPLAEVLNLLATLSEAWAGAPSQSAPPSSVSAGFWGVMRVPEAEPVARAWSF